MCIIKQISYFLVVILFLINFTPSNTTTTTPTLNIKHDIKDDNKFGVMEVHIYNPDLFECNAHIIKLSVNESITKASDCTKDITFDTMYFHTLISSCDQLKVCHENKTSETCTQNITAEYFFTFSGCYQVQVSNRYVDDSEINSAPFWVESLYVKEELNKAKPVYNISRNLAMNTTNLYFYYSRLDMLLLENTLHFEIFNKTSKLESYCTKWYIGDKIASNTELSKNEIVTMELRKCYSEDLPSAEKCTFDYAKKLINCLFVVPNFSTYDFALDLDFSSTPCLGTSLWRNLNTSCRWQRERFHIAINK